MTHRTRIPAVVLLVAMALCVGVPPSLFALERPLDIATVTGDEPGSATFQPQSAADDGDPDDWASRSNDDSSTAGGAMLGETGGPSDEWLDYLEFIRGLLIRIKMNLAGIL